MIGIFGDKHLRYRALGGQTALDKPGRRRRLHHHVLTSSAAIFGSPNHQHAELCRHDVEPFARILADPMQRLATARTGIVVDVDHHLDARQVFGKRSSVHPALGGSACPLGRIDRVALGLAARRNLLDVFKPEQHLIFGQRLGAPPEAMTLQFLDDLEQPFVLRTRSAISIALSVPASSGSESVTTVMARLDHASRCVASISCRIHSLCRNHPGCIDAGISRAA